jgi:hypothetical protein
MDIWQANFVPETGLWERVYNMELFETKQVLFFGVDPSETATSSPTTASPTHGLSHCLSHNRLSHHRLSHCLPNHRISHHPITHRIRSDLGPNHLPNHRSAHWTADCVSHNRCAYPGPYILADNRLSHHLSHNSVPNHLISHCLPDNNVPNHRLSHRLSHHPNLHCTGSDLGSHHQRAYYIADHLSYHSSPHHFAH